jgi:hypothetical protein
MGTHENRYKAEKEERLQELAGRVPMLPNRDRRINEREDRQTGRAQRQRW